MSIQIVFLGTGSGKPMPQRNVSSVALFREGELFLFDCGEATQLQLTRSGLRPGAIRAIFLSHFHGDHVNGLPGLIGSLTLNQREEALDIYGPRGLRRWFKTLHELHILRPGFRVRLHEVAGPGKVFEGDGFHVATQALNHRVETWGYTLIEDQRPGRFDLEQARELGIPSGPLFGRLQRGETITLSDGRQITPSQVLGPARPGLKIAYCCDTIPCEGALELARDADLVIHEATYVAGEERSAHQRGHSTSADAARCAREAGAQRLILTHISQKHLDLHEVLRGARSIFPNTEIARDLAEFSVERKDQ
ncbi:ribonuclease Z [Lujinxingia litoralis]|uniref:Ribonuclease Z n=1 Tax=Lujinxingia litoralis TaxID=2211119 RepID=A0A328C8S8_9DELT|nr:ribonuclease Z [Lujinxingia litoralis]RAL23900.1 ribonuclease Z [Lujinxingia litoralis]